MATEIRQMLPLNEHRKPYHASLYAAGHAYRVHINMDTRVQFMICDVHLQPFNNGAAQSLSRAGRNITVYRFRRHQRKGGKEML